VPTARKVTGVANNILIQHLHIEQHLQQYSETTNYASEVNVVCCVWVLLWRRQGSC